MKKLLMPFLAGLAGATVAMSFIGKSFATIDASEIDAAIQSGQCQVYVGSGSMTAGSRCFRGEVMTGYWNDTILCANINVTCN